MKSLLNVQGAAISDGFSAEDRNIVLPNQSEFLPQIAVDIGGSLAKVVWFSQSSTQNGGRLNFTKFETSRIEDCISFIQKIFDKSSGIPTRQIKATGGGAHKFQDLFQEKLGIDIQKEDEMHCLITGLNFLVQEIPYEVFSYDERRAESMVFDTSVQTELFPYLVVNIGSGVSILKVTGEDSYERVSGTSLGGGTLWGLLSLLTDAESYDDMLELSKFGDNKNVDMLVGDIYGGSYSKIGLKATTIASSFGKVFKTPKTERKNFKQEDISRSLLYLVSNTIGQIAYLNAQAHGVNRIFFSGFFIRGHPITMNTLSYAIDFWSKGQMQALFLRHEGYLGAIGAFVRHAPSKRNSAFLENFSYVSKISGNSISAVGVLESLPMKLEPFPLIDLETYDPDTTRLQDAASQQYWFDLLDKNLEALVDLALTWQGRKEDSHERARIFTSLYREHLDRLKNQPNSYGLLTVRSLLNLREQCLQEMGFYDIFEGVKADENMRAMEQLPHLFLQLDLLQEPELIETLIKNVLAGNMYDWGSTAVQMLLKKGQLDFETAKSKVGYPDKYNHLVQVKERLLKGPDYKKIVIFVDNSGADILLGILPLARYFLRKNSQVILAANDFPSVNDITARELLGLVERLCQIDVTLETAWKNRSLKIMGTGSSSPCLDLSRINSELAKECKTVDLVILEGMGRAIHTNFYTHFHVDSLKLAVFKNPKTAEWLNAAFESDRVIMDRINGFHDAERDQYVYGQAGKNGFIWGSTATAASLALHNGYGPQRLVTMYNSLITRPYKVFLVACITMGAYFTRLDSASLEAQKAKGLLNSIDRDKYLLPPSSGQVILPRVVEEKPFEWTMEGINEYVYGKRFSIISGLWVIGVSGALLYNYARKDMSLTQKMVNIRLTGQTAALAACVGFGLALSEPRRRPLGPEAPQVTILTSAK